MWLFGSLPALIPGTRNIARPRHSFLYVGLPGQRSSVLLFDLMSYLPSTSLKYIFLTKQLIFKFAWPDKHHQIFRLPPARPIQMSAGLFKPNLLARARSPIKTISWIKIVLNYYYEIKILFNLFWNKIWIIYYVITVFILFLALVRAYGLKIESQLAQLRTWRGPSPKKSSLATVSGCPWTDLPLGNTFFSGRLSMQAPNVLNNDKRLTNCHHTF